RQLSSTRSPHPNRSFDESGAAPRIARLPVRDSPAPRRELPLLPELLRLRARSHRSLRSGQGVLACAATRRALPSLSPGRLRSGAVTPALAVRPTPHACVHGYPTPDPVRHLFVLGVYPMGPLAGRASAAAANVGPN